MMSEFCKFSSDNPFLTVILIVLVAGLVARLIPWFKKPPDDWMD